MKLAVVAKKPFLLFLISIVLYQTGSIVRIQLESQLLGNSFRMLGCFILFYSLIYQLTKGRHQPLTLIMKILLTWNILNIVGSIIFTGGSFTRFFGEDTYLLNYLLPFILFYDVRQIPFHQLFRYCFIFVLFAAILILINFKYLTLASQANKISSLLSENNSLQLLAQIPIMWSLPASIIFMNYNLVNKKTLIISIIAFLFAIAFSMTFGRRTTSAYGIVFLLVAFGFYYFQAKLTINKRLCILIIMGVFTIIIINFAINNFEYLIERGFEDSRSNVNDAFYKDMNWVDYIFGRGLNGKYYDPMDIFEKIKGLRTDIETGYLNVILHSGCLFLIPYWLVCFHSAYIGYFKAKNTLIKSFAVYILINSLMLIIGSYPAFNLRFFILWTGIILCNNKKLRQMQNHEIYKLFNL